MSVFLLRLLSLISILAISACNSGDFSSQAPNQQGQSLVADQEIQASLPAVEAPEEEIADEDPCTEFFESPDFHISGSSQSESLNTSEQFYLKITGSSNQVGFQLNSSLQLETSCVFIAGGENQLELTVDANLGRLIIVARGSTPAVELVVASGASISEIAWDARGNLPGLVVHGEGNYTCPESTGFGTISCDNEL